MNYGVTLTSLYRNQEALDAYQQALKAHELQLNRHTDVPLIYYNMGIALWNLGRSQESLDAFLACRRFVKIAHKHSLLTPWMI